MNDNSNRINYKFLLIGDSSVGKTCVFKKLTVGTFDERGISTIGVDKKTIKLDGVEVISQDERLQTRILTLRSGILLDKKDIEQYQKIII